MSKKKVLVIAGILFMMWYVITQAQERTVTLRYKINVGDVWEYECVTEEETERESEGYKEKFLGNIKEHFKYEGQELTPEGYWKVKLSTTPIESKGVNITADEKEDMHDFVAGCGYEEIFINLKGEVLTMSVASGFGNAIFLFRKDGILTGINENLIRFFHPVMSEGKVGINDTWTCKVGVVPEIFWATHDFGFVVKYPTAIIYTVVAFEKKDGFDCAKIEYNYEHDFTGDIKQFAKEKGLDVDNWKREIILKGKGTIYFAYNEGFLVSRKENLMRTNIESTLYQDVGWQVTDKSTTRIGFTMNYIKP